MKTVSNQCFKKYVLLKKKWKTSRLGRVGLRGRHMTERPRVRILLLLNRNIPRESADYLLLEHLEKVKYGVEKIALATLPRLKA